MKVSESEIRNASILIVDDQLSNVELLHALLVDAGYTKIHTTMDPTEVCELHRKNSYDLILLDLQMPVMDGFAVMEALKFNEVDPYLSVLVITAQPSHKLRALQAGAKDFISKPFDLVEARTRVRNLLEVRLVYKQLEALNRSLERIVEVRTAQLRESEARYRSFTELAADWYWEQDEHGVFSKVSGPVQEMLGVKNNKSPGGEAGPLSWDNAEHAALTTAIEERRPFLDFVFSRTLAGGAQRRFRVSGEPMFDLACRFVGYRGIGVEITPEAPTAMPVTGGDDVNSNQ